ncbi:hypothetical protein J437_LFUL016487 [Ladona fulva]|uniref:Uncharacterized protein n=1 Tax=Ladona fulva TaxID=123851 RepID=A0A8K0KL31_LADFU|nr:hypothetical protein J437_LFUL016487 [Ladona fulva]
MHLREDFPTLIENIRLRTSNITMQKNFIIPKLVAVLDRRQLSMKDSGFILEVTIEAFGYNTDEFPKNVVTAHWDGKLLPVLDARKSKEERLPKVILYVNKEQLIAVPRLESSSGSRQVQADETRL